MRRKEKLWVLPVAGIGGLVGAVVYLVMLVGIYASMLAAGKAAGHPELVMFYALLGSWVFIFVTAIPLSLSLLYYSTDLKMLLPLPVRPLQIVAAKGMLLYLYCLPVNLLFMVPALVLYVRDAGAAASTVVSAAIHLLVSPLLPLGLAVLLVLALMKAVNLSRFRVALEVGGMTVAIVLVIGLQVVLSRSAMAGLGGGTFDALGSFPDLYGTLSRVLPPAAWAAGGFVPGAGAGGPLASLALTAAAAGAAFLLAPVNFLRDVTERREPGSRRRRARAAAAGAAALPAPRAPLASLLAREWAVLASSSSSLFEAFGEMLILPLLLGVYSLLIPRNLVGQAMAFLGRSPAMSLILMGVLVLMTGLTTVSATSISREGKLFSLSLTLPVKGRVQVGAKLLLHLVFFTSAYLLDLVLCAVIFRLPLLSLAYMLPGGIALQVASFCAGIFFDLKKPLLKWTNPQQAMKQNMNAMAGIGVSFAMTALLAAPCAVLVLAGVDPFLVGCLAAGAAVALAAVLLPLLLSWADRRYGGGLEMEG
jgi:ABC-2 type transport system permease protein